MLSIATLLLALSGCIFISKKDRRSVLVPLHGWAIMLPILFCMSAAPFEWGTTSTRVGQTLLGYFAIVVGGLYMRYFSLEAVWKKIWMMAAAIAAAIPLSWLITHPMQAIDRIKIGKTLPVPMDGDHLRFSIFIASALLLSLTLDNKIKKYASIYFTATLLLLSVRTGIVLAALIVAGQLPLVISRRTKNRNVGTLERQQLDDRRWTMEHRKKAIVYSLWSMVFLLSFPFLYQKINYALYDWQQFNINGYNPNYSDGVRRAMNTAAMKSEVPFGGVGWEQITPVLSKSFYTLYHQSLPFGWPFNQWLFWWMGAGVIGTIIFSAWLLYPIYHGWKTKQYTLCIWALAITFTCFTETTLNYQFGVFLHIWPLLLLAKPYQRSNL